MFKTYKQTELDNRAPLEPWIFRRVRIILDILIRLHFIINFKSAEVAGLYGKRKWFKSENEWFKYLQVRPGYSTERQRHPTKFGWPSIWSALFSNSNLFYLVSPLVLGCTLLSLVDIQSDRPELPSLKTFQSSENVDYEPEEEKVTIEMF